MVSIARVTCLLSMLTMVATSARPLNYLRPNNPQENVPALEAGKPVVRELAGGEAQVFQVMLNAGQYLQVQVDQRGIDAVLRLFAPGGRKLVEMDSLNGTQGPEIAALIAEQPGTYRIEVASSSKAVPAGRYEMKIVSLRYATEQDRESVGAQSGYLEGGRLLQKGTADTLRESIHKFEEVLPRWRVAGDLVMEIHTLLYLGSANRRLGQFQKALEFYEDARRLAQVSGDKREDAAAMAYMAGVHNEAGAPLKALEYYDRVLSVWRAAGDVYNEAKLQNSIGLTYALEGDPREALKHYEQALAIWRQLKNRELLANTLNNVGGAYNAMGDEQQALENFKQALALYRELGNRGGEAEALNNIGVAYGNLGEPRKALDYYGQALPIWHASGDRRREGYALRNIAINHAALGDPEQALDYYNRSLKLLREAGDRRGEAFSLQRLGDFYASAGEFKKALEQYEPALQLRRAGGDRWGESSVLAEIGEVHRSLGDPQKAREYFNQALTLIRVIGDRRGEAKILYGIARAERDTDHLDEARRQIEAAISKVEATRVDVSQQLRASYLATVEDYYQFYIDLLMRLNEENPNEGFAALALQTSERARGRSLLDMLTESHVEIRKGADPLLLEKERILAQQLNAKAERRIQLFGQKGGEEQLAALNKEINDLEIENDQLQAAIRKASPAYAALTQPQPLGLKEIQTQLDQGTLLLEYSLGEERSYVWAVTRNSLKTYELPKREQIEKAARRVYELLTARSQSKAAENPQQKQARIAQTDSQLIHASQELSQMVLGPIGSELGAERLVIVADGALQYIPFSALSVVGGQTPVAQRSRTNNRAPTIYRPLIQDHEIISLPSVSALAIQRHGLLNRKPAPNAVAVIADPVFSATDERLGVQAKSGAAKQVQGDSSANTRLIEHLADDSGLIIRRLKFTRQEADQILAEAPRAKTFRAIDFKANRAAATGGELSKYRYVHFATHGYIDSERPDLSAIVLSLVDESGKPQDGFLRAHEIYNLNLPAELVVLSACETGLGKEIKGEGLVGLTRGFMYAGARRVVVSLWNVNDKATAELMARFYRGMLKENKTPAAALRTAQIEMSRQRQWQSPYYWGAFVLQGEWK
jgi:CHAT domain-containing protein/tetratricopeptide (TPR) repeat protein